MKTPAQIMHQCLNAAFGLPFQSVSLREGDTSNSRFCGVVTPFTYDLQHMIISNIGFGLFDFVVTPLIHPDYRPSIAAGDLDIPSLRVLPYGGSDFTVRPSNWIALVVGKISSWIDLDSEDETLRSDSEAILKREIEWASYLSLRACLLPAPKGTSCINYARCVNQILQDLKNMELWLRIPFGVPFDSLRTWNSFRLLCDHHSRLYIALDVDRQLPSEFPEKRWYGEPVIAAIIDEDAFLSKSRKHETKHLSKRHQKLIADFFDHSIQIIISGKQGQPKLTLEGHAPDSKKHPLWAHVDHVRFLYQRMDPLSVRDRGEFDVRDILQSALNPRKDYSRALSYEVFERDEAKYSKYKLAIRQALLDRVSDEKASEITTVLMVVGAGRGPLVQASINAAKEANRKLKVYAVDKNPNTAIALEELILSKNWDNMVTIISHDVCNWTAPEKADILVSDLLGSFGDNELSPEILDKAQRSLKNNGISIPTLYSSFLQPLTASKLYNHAKEQTDILNFETAGIAKLHNVAWLAPPQRVFTFRHPKRIDKDGNQQYRKLQFSIPDNTGSAMVHGFAGYFDATLYKDVCLGIEPSRATPNVFTWLPMFFPLKTPIWVHGGSILEVHFWRCCDDTRVWYEWCVTSPVSPIHNGDGRSYLLEM